MNCSKAAPTNGSRSELFDFIYTKIANENESKAEALYSHFNTNVFKATFGNWTGTITEDTVLGHVDINGEPRIFEKETGDGFYYIDKKGNQIDFPKNNSSLFSKIAPDVLDNLVQSLALKYLTFSKGVSFENINFEDAKQNVGLKNYLSDLITSRIEELKDVRTTDVLLPKRHLPLLLEELDEAATLISDFYKTMDLTLTETEENIALEGDIDEGGRDTVFNQASYERNAKENVRTNAKLRLSLIPNVQRKDVYFGGNSYLAFDDVYNTLLPLLSNNFVMLSDTGAIIDSTIELVARLRKLSNKRPEFKVLADTLSNPNTSENIKLEIYQAFNLQRNKILATDMKGSIGYQMDGETPVLDEYGELIMNNNITYSSKDITQTASKSNSLRQEWNYNFWKNYVSEETSVEEVQAKVSKFAERTRSILKEISFDKTHALTSTMGEKGLSTGEYVKDTISKIMSSLFNYEVDPRALDDLLNDTTDNNTPALNATRLLNRFALDLDRASTRVKFAIASKDSDSNLLNDSQVLREIGDAETLYHNAQSDASLTASGKNIYLHQNKSHISGLIETWKQRPNELMTLYKSGAYQEGSKVMEYLLALETPANVRDQISKDRLSSLDVAIFANFFTEIGEEKDSGASKDMTKEQYAIDHLNKIIAGIQDKATFSRTTTPSDKTTDLQIGYNYFQPSFKSYNSRRNSQNLTINDETVATFLKYFESETKRMAYEKVIVQTAKEKGDYSKLKVHYHFKKDTLKDDGIGVLGNAFKSQYFPGLSFGANVKGSPTAMRLAKSIQSRLYDADGMIAYEVAEGYLSTDPMMVDEDGTSENALKRDIEQYIRVVMSENILSTHARLKDMNILTYDARGFLKSSKLDSTIMEDYYSSKLPADLTGLAIASDFYVNSVIRNIEFSKMFTGDIAYYKDSVDYKKRVPATYTDGIMPLLQPGDEFFKIAVIDAVEVASPFHDRMVQTYGQAVADKYNKINSSDAQAWITPQRWAKLMKGMRWTPTHESVYSKMMSGKVEQYTNDELKLVAQPLKGVYFYRNKDGSPLYLKYSQAVLTPQLVKGTPLENIYNKMMDTVDGFDELITLDGVKVGSPATTRIHNEDGSVVSDPKFNVFRADSRGWKLQQDLPTKGYKDTEVGSQIQKNIFAGLKNNPTMMFDVGGELMSGEQVMDEITNTVKSLSDRGLRNLFKEFGIGEDGTIQNIDRYYESLIDELKSRNGSRNIIDALEKRMTLYGVPQVRSKIDNMFASILNKRVVKIKTNGGSFIQMSNFGMNYVEATNSGVILHPKFSEMTKGKNTTFEPLEQVDPVTGRKKIDPAGIFISGAFIAKYIPNYKDYTSAQLFGEYDENGVKTKDGIIDSRILENLVGYRIPNQGLASNDALQIVGILPEENGDTIVAYTGITTKTGSDFDIDKMYIMMPSFDVTTISNDNLAKILKSRYKGSNIKQTIKNLRDAFHELSDSDVEFDFTEFAKLQLDPNTTLEVLDQSASELASFLLSSDNIDSTVVQNLMKEANIIVSKLRYANKEGSKAADQNKLIELYKSVLTQPDIIQDVMTPIDFSFMKDNIVHLTESMSTDTNTALFHFEPLADIDLLYDFRNGKAGVGQEANWMVDISRRGDLSLSNISNYFDFLKNQEGVISLDPQKSMNLSEQDLSDYIQELGLTKESQINDLKDEIIDIDVMSSMVAILNAFVDIAKDPYITRGNWLMNTTGLGNILFRMGMHPLYVTSFMLQPGVRIMSNHPFQNINRYEDDYLVNTRLIHDSLKDVTYNGVSETITDFMYVAAEVPLKTSEHIGAAIQERFPHLASTIVEDISTKIASGYYTLDKSKEVIPSFKNLKFWNNQAKGGKIDLAFQKGIANMVRELGLINVKLKDNLTVSKMDTSGSGASISNMYVLENTLTSLVKPSKDKKKPKLNGLVSKFINSPLAVYTNNLRNVFNIAKKNPNLFIDLSEHNLAVADSFSRMIGEEYFKNSELYDVYKNELYSMTMTDFFSMTNTETSDLLTSFPSEFADFKNINKDKFPILEELNVKTTTSSLENVNSLIFLSNRKRNGTQETRLVKSWEQLHDKFPEFSEKLIKYSFATTGFKYSSTQFYSLIPNSYFIEKDINNFVKRHVTNSAFPIMFLANNFENPIVASAITSGNVPGVIHEYGMLDYSNVAKPLPTVVRYGGSLYMREDATTYSRVDNTSFKIGNSNISDYHSEYISSHKSVMAYSQFQSRNRGLEGQDTLSLYLPVETVTPNKSKAHATDLLQGVTYEGKSYVVGKTDNNDNIFIVDSEGKGEWVKYSEVTINDSKGVITTNGVDGNVLAFEDTVFDLHDLKPLPELKPKKVKGKTIIENQLDLFGDSQFADFSVTGTNEATSVNDVVENYRSKLIRKGFTNEQINQIQQELITSNSSIKDAEQYFKECIK